MKVSKEFFGILHDAMDSPIHKCNLTHLNFFLGYFPMSWVWCVMQNMFVHIFGNFGYIFCSFHLCGCVSSIFCLHATILNEVEQYLLSCMIWAVQQIYGTALLSFFYCLRVPCRMIKYCCSSNSSSIRLAQHCCLSDTPLITWVSWRASSFAKEEEKTSFALIP